MFKKATGIFSIALFLCMILINYSAGADKFEWPDYIKVATPNVGTANHSIASAWTAEFSASTGVRARVLPAPNGYARAEWLSTGEADLALMQASDYIERMDAIEGYATRKAGPADTRTIYLSLVCPWGFMVRGDSYIKSIKDISPKTRVAWYRGSSFIMTGIRALLATQGLTPEDVNLVEVGSYAANSRVIAEGRADVAFTSPISDLNYDVAANPNGVRWLEIPTEDEDPKAYRDYKRYQAGYVLARCKSGVESARGVRMSQAYQNYHVRGDEDEDFVYHLVKWLDENHHLYRDKYVHAKLMTLQNFIELLENNPVEPVHPGTIRYLREKGLWKGKYERQNKFNLELSEKYIKTFQAALKEADKKGVKISPQNREWIHFWKQFKKEHGLETSYGVVERPR